MEDPEPEAVSDSSSSGHDSEEQALPEEDIAGAQDGLLFTAWVTSSARRSKFGHLVRSDRAYPLDAPGDGFAVPACSSRIRHLSGGGREGTGLLALYAENKELCPMCVTLLSGRAEAEFVQLVADTKAAS